VTDRALCFRSHWGAHYVVDSKPIVSRAGCDLAKLRERRRPSDAIAMRHRGVSPCLDLPRSCDKILDVQLYVLLAIPSSLFTECNVCFTVHFGALLEALRASETEVLKVVVEWLLRHALCGRVVTISRGASFNALVSASCAYSNPTTPTIIRKPLACDFPPRVDSPSHRLPSSESSCKGT